MVIGTKKFDLTARAYIMGILNITPDSFYDGGRYNALDAALFRTEQMIAEGADIIDVGGESTRPGFAAISAEEEAARVIPVIAAIKARFDIPVSCDTYKSAAALAAIQAGADMINDVYGLQRDEKMAKVIARAGVACVLAQGSGVRGQGLGVRETINEKRITNNGELNQITNADDDKRNDGAVPAGGGLSDVPPNSLTSRRDYLFAVSNGLKNSLRLAHDAGIANDKIIVDPGIGFGKTTEQNLRCIADLAQFVSLGYPVLVGASNKSFIGAVLNAPAHERLYGTLAATAIAVLNGASFIRVHDVKENKQAIKMAEAIKYSRKI